MPRQTIQQKALKSVEQYLGRICGVDVDDDGTDYQRRLILGEEEDLPQLAPDTRRRGPYMSPALASVTSPVPRANTAGLLSQYRAAAAGAGPSDIPVVPPNVQRRIAAEAHGLKPDARLDGGFAGFPQPPGARSFRSHSPPGSFSQYDSSHSSYRCSEPRHRLHGPKVTAAHAAAPQ